MLQKRVDRFLKTHGVGPGASALVGYSGGPDSTCLVSLLHRLAPALRLKLACAYLDHGLRPEPERKAEEDHVRRFCRDLGIPLFVRRLEPGALASEAKRNSLSLEEAARRARLDFFRGLREEQGFSHLLLAHTLDDQLETVIMRIFQGSGPGGIRGIRARRGWILRPLLTTSRREIMEYLQAQGLSYSTDSTNAEGRFLRNRIRNTLIPALQEVFPGLGRSLLALTAKMRDVDSYLRRQAARAFAWEETENGVKTDAALFFAAPPALRLYALYPQAARLAGKTERKAKNAVPYRFLAPLLSREAGRQKKILRRGFGTVIRRDRGDLFLERDIVAIGKKGYFINVLSGRPFALFDQWFVLRMPGEEQRRTDDLLCAFKAQKVTPPFVLRSRKIGDRIDLGFGTKRLKKLFNEWRAGPAEKDAIPVLEDGRGILAVLGGLCGFKNVVRREADAFPERPGEGKDDIRLFQTKSKAQNAKIDYSRIRDSRKRGDER
jgi:tRNA(Ile)-lysidine synthetase-like protein